MIGLDNGSRTGLMDRLYTREVRYVFVLLQLILLYMPHVALFSIWTDNGPIPGSLCYFFSLLAAPYFLVNIKKLKWPPWYLMAFIVFVFVWAVVQMPRYGLSKSILHWSFALYLHVLLLTFGNDFSREQWLKLLETGACVFALLHLGYALINGDYYLKMLKGYFDGSSNGYYASLIPSMTRGGRNLDATWLALGAYFVRGKKKAFYFSYALLYSFVVSSRVGIIGLGCVVLWSLIYDPMYRLNGKRLKWYILYAAVMAMVLICTGCVQGLLSRIGIHLPVPSQLFGIVSRQEAEVMAAGLPSTGFFSGREYMWQLAPEMFSDNPLGYGVGNALRVMRAEYGYTKFEDVMHNVFLQLTLDEGIVGAVWFVGIVILFLASQWKLRPRLLEKPIAVFFFTYLILSLVQFHGGEALMHFTMAVGIACPSLLFAKDTEKPEQLET